MNEINHKTLVKFEFPFDRICEKSCCTCNKAQWLYAFTDGHVAGDCLHPLPLTVKKESINSNTNVKCPTYEEAAGPNGKALKDFHGGYISDGDMYVCPYCNEWYHYNEHNICYKWSKDSSTKSADKTN